MIRTLLLPVIFLFVFTSVSFAQVAQYDFDGNANDITGNGNDGTVNGATLSPDRFGYSNNAYAFDGNDYIQFPQDFDFPNRTISLWFKANDIPSSGAAVYNSDNNDLVNGNTIITTIEVNGVDYLRFVTGGETSNIVDVPVSVDTWYMATITRDTDSAFYYLDGELMGAAPATTNSSIDVNNTALIGASRLYDRHFNGTIDDLEIYDIALTAALVEELFIEGSQDPQSPYACYPLNENAEDTGVKQLDGTVVGATGAVNRFGTANSSLAFDGNDYVTFPENFDFEERTVSVWFNAASITTTASVVYASDNAEVEFGNTIITVVKVDGENRVRFVSGGSTENIMEEPIQANKWYMATITRDTAAAKYYLNGELVGSVDATSVASVDVSGTAHLGTSRLFDRYFTGMMDDLKIYRIALSESQVDSLYCYSTVNPAYLTNTVTVYDTVTVQETVYDTVQVTDTLIHYDSVQITDTIQFMDTLLVYDTIPVMDTITITDTVIVYDTIPVMDTITIMDTVVVYDSVSVSVTDTLIIQLNLTTGVDDMLTSTMKVYPNPATTHLTVSFTNYDGLENHAVIITNANGQEVLNQSIGNQDFEIDLSTWTGTGLYLLRVVDEHGQIVDARKIVLQ